MPVVYGVAALAVVAAHCGWRAFTWARLRRERRLCRRVAYLLWVMAGQEDGAPARGGVRHLDDNQE
jgi:hypothetical protein